MGSKFLKRHFHALSVENFNLLSDKFSTKYNSPVVIKRGVLAFYRFIGLKEE